MVKKRISQIVGTMFLAVMAITSCAEKNDYGYKLKDGRIVYNTPPRPSDQISMLGYAADPIEKIRVGFIGLGMRGPGAVDRFTYLEDATIVALCDLLEERVKAEQKKLADKGINEVDGYWGEQAWKQVCEREDIDLIYLAVPWQYHTQMAVYMLWSTESMWLWRSRPPLVSRSVGIW